MAVPFRAAGKSLNLSGSQPSVSEMGMVLLTMQSWGEE